MSTSQENNTSTAQPATTIQPTTAAYQYQYVPQYSLPYPQSQAQLQMQMQMNQPLTTAQSAASTSATTQVQTSVAGPGPSTSAATTGTSTAQGNTTAAQTAAQQAQAQRQAAEQARKDRTLADFLLMLDEYEPLIPNEVTDYYLQRVGFECEDVRLKRLLSLAAQKFVSDIAADAYQHARIRTNAAAGGRGRAPVGGQSIRDKTRTTLTMEDLSAALSEYGINARKPEFYM